MAGFVIFKKFTLEEAVTEMRRLEDWFRAHPKRHVCRTDLFEVRRGHIVEDVLKHASA